MNKYQIILDVCETGNISKTAEKLCYTRSAVSQCIKNFEQEIGHPLFQRTKSGMVPLACADPILEQLRLISSAQQKIEAYAAGLNNLDHGHIRIGTIQSISYHLLPDILRLFSDSYPKITFDITVQGFQMLTEALDANQLDCIFTSRYAAPSEAFIPLIRDELMLVTPREHALTDQFSVSLSDIDGEDYILSSDKLDYETGQIFRENHVTPKIRYHLNEDFSVLKMVEKGFGITILPKLLLKDIPFDVCVRPFTEHYQRILGICWPNDAAPSPALSKFLDYIKNTFALTL